SGRAALPSRDSGGPGARRRGGRGRRRAGPRGRPRVQPPRERPRVPRPRDRAGPAFDVIDVDPHAATVRAGGATALPSLARQTAAAGLTGLEWAVGVPGSVGGAVRMNAGGHGSDIAATIRCAGVADLARGGVVQELASADLDLAYRHSAIGSGRVVAWAEF